MKNYAPSCTQDNPTPNINLEIVKLLQRAASGLSDSLDVVLDLNPRAPAAAELEKALGRGLRGVTALKRLMSMGSSGAAVNTAESEKGRQAAPLCAFQASHTQPTVGLKKRRPRRHFDKDYKRWVVQLRRERNLTISEISKELNLTYSAVCSWVREFEAQQTASAQARTEQEERIGALEELVQQLRTDNELLKKASAFFAREICNAAPAGVGQ